MNSHRKDSIAAKLKERNVFSTQLATIIVETIREPLLILDGEFRVIYANESFYKTFQVTAQETESEFFYKLGNNQWDIPQLREILEKTLPQKKVLTDFLVEHDFPHLGHRIMQLNASQISLQEKQMPLVLLVIEDITDQKNKETELSNSKNLLQSIMDHAGSMLAYLDRNFNYVYVNRLYAKNLGFSIREMIGKNHFDLFEDSKNYQIFSEVRKNRKTFHQQDIQIPFIKEPQKTKYYDFTISAVENNQGTLKGFILTLTDTTKRKENEDLINASEERYELAQRMAGMGTWEWDIKTNELIWSPEVSRLFGFDRVPNRLTYKKFLRMVHPEDRDKVEEGVNQCIEEQKEYNVDHRIRFPDGSVRWMREKGNVLRDKNNLAVKMLGVVMDITSEKKALLEKARLATIVDNSTDAIVLYTPRGIIIHWNTGAGIIYGYTENEIEGKSVSLLVPEQKKDELNEILREIQEGKSIRYLETIRKKKNGKEIHIAMTVSPIRNDEGKVTAISTIERDITNRKEMEAKLRQHQQELEKRVKQRTAELVRSRDKLQKEVEERRHYQEELRSLASGISLIEEQERRKIATYLHDQVVQTLVYANMKLGQLEQMKETAPQKDTLNEVGAYIKETISDLRNLTFEISPPILYELGFVKAVEWLAQQYREKWETPVKVKSTSLSQPLDETKRVVLFQSVRECLNNIMKHAQSNKNTIFIREQRHFIEVEIIDEGKGFNPKEMKLSTEVNHGFGLINIRERLEYLNGSLDIQSRRGKGTRVLMQLPLNRRD